LDGPSNQPLVPSLPEDDEFEKVANPKSKIQNESVVPLDITRGNE
jgi:hypothetical protein